MKQPIPAVVLTGGGTGGHITPLLSLAQELRAQSPQCQIIYIGQKGDQFDTFQQSSHDFDFTAFIRAGKLRRYGTLRFSGLLHPDIFAKNFMDMLRLPGSVIVAIRILRKFKPGAVFSKGGFVALPVTLAARMLGIALITHDSDTVPGLANRIAGRWAKAHATGMPAEYYPYPKDSTYYVGIPVDPRIKKVTPKLQKAAKQQLGLPAESTVLLASGGSSGSVQLNDLMISVAAELLESNLSLYILHLSGQRHEAALKQAYMDLPKHDQKRIVVIAYSQEFYALAAAADLVVTRAGATTIAELAAAGKACIVVPSPHLAGGHQLKNAQALADIDAAAIAPPNVQPDELLVLISGLLNDDSRRFELARNLFATARPGASKELAALILKIAAK
jgi:UDP-N-acetylglucosamine--N-acetylmuramyl-(pentapeptide) pyrophosphoryl-undecaprenol N-acetylglucosamine transferase